MQNYNTGPWVSHSQNGLKWWALSYYHLTTSPESTVFPEKIPAFLRPIFPTSSISTPLCVSLAPPTLWLLKKKNCNDYICRLPKRIVIFCFGIKHSLYAKATYVTHPGVSHRNLTLNLSSKAQRNTILSSTVLDLWCNSHLCQMQNKQNTWKKNAICCYFVSQH